MFCLVGLEINTVKVFWILFTTSNYQIYTVYNSLSSISFSKIGQLDFSELTENDFDYLISNYKSTVLGSSLTLKNVGPQKCLPLFLTLTNTL